MFSACDTRDKTPKAAAAVKGSAAIANARLAYEAYEAYEQLTASERWQRLARLGARPQRPLWASTGVNNPAYPDTKYVAGLIARHRQHHARTDAAGPSAHPRSALRLLPGRVPAGSTAHSQGGQGESAKQYHDSDDQQV
jgi:hypothetical protein